MVQRMSDMITRWLESDRVGAEQEQEGQQARQEGQQAQQEDQQAQQEGQQAQQEGQQVQQEGQQAQQEDQQSQPEGQQAQLEGQQAQLEAQPEGHEGQGEQQVQQGAQTTVDENQNNTVAMEIGEEGQEGRGQGPSQVDLAARMEESCDIGSLAEESEHASIGAMASVLKQGAAVSAERDGAQGGPSIPGPQEASPEASSSQPSAEPSAEAKSNWPGKHSGAELVINLEYQSQGTSSSTISMNYVPAEEMAGIEEPQPSQPVVPSGEAPSLAEDSNDTEQTSNTGQEGTTADSSPTQAPNQDSSESSGRTESSVAGSTENSSASGLERSGPRYSVNYNRRGECWLLLMLRPRTFIFHVIILRLQQLSTQE